MLSVPETFIEKPDVSTVVTVDLDRERRNRVEDYEDKLGKYKEKYGDSLSQPSEELKVAIVVPAFAELENDNFWRMFRSLMYQRGVKQNEFEVIYVVNNSEEVVNAVVNSAAVNSNRYEGSAGETRKKRFLENQNHIRTIKVANQAQAMVQSGYEGDIDKWIMEEVGKIDTVLSDYEIDLITRFAKSNVSLQYIDASSQGRAFTGGDKTNPIGLARDIGSFMAYDRFKEINEEGMIDFIDGDCFLDPNYVSGIVTLMNEGKDVIVKPLKKVVAEVPRQIEESTNPHTKVLSTIKYLATVFSGWNYFEENINRYDNNGNPLRVYSRLGGPQLTVRTSVLPEVGGYENEKMNEDWIFSYEVVKKTAEEKIGTLEKSSVLISDRGRDGSTDGKDRGELSGHFSDKIEREYSLNNSAESRIGSLCMQERDFLSELEVLSTIGDFAGIYLFNEYLKIKKECFEKDSKIRYELIEKAGRWLEIAEKADYKNMSTEELIDWVYSHNKVKKTDRDFFEQNKVLVDLVVDVLKMSEDGTDSDEDRVMLSMLYLEELLPEYFKSPVLVVPSSDRRGEHDNVADYSHIAEAIYRMRVRIRNKMLEQKKIKEVARNNIEQLQSVH